MLKGEIVKASGPLAQLVAYKTVLDAAHMQLDSAAKDPELFDFFMGFSVDKNTYFDDYSQFQSAFVDSSLRQLRFAAFAVANKVPVEFPLAKIAIIKRAYRKKQVLVLLGLLRTHGAHVQDHCWKP